VDTTCDDAVVSCAEACIGIHAMDAAATKHMTRRNVFTRRVSFRKIGCGCQPAAN